MKVNVMTRSANDDYSPVGPKWDTHIRSKYGLNNYGSAETSNIFMINTGGDIQCLINGIASPRRDTVNRKIRYSLQLFGNKSDGAAIVNVVGHALTACDGASAKEGILTKLLEETIGKNVERWVRQERNGPEATAAVESLSGKLSSLPKASPGSKIESNLMGLVNGDRDAPQIAARLTFLDSKDSGMVKEVEKGFSGYSKIMIFPVEREW